MDHLQSSGQNSPSIAKIAAVLAGTAAAAVVLARFAVPYSVAALSVVVPLLWSAARVLFAPPYLFITVHLIIVAIWKLSDQKLHRGPADSVKPADRNAAPSKPAPPPAPAGSAAAAPISGSGSAGSCVTTDSDDDSAVSSRPQPAEGEEGMGLEDTWQAIVMKKSATWERSTVTSAVSAEAPGDSAVVRRSVTFTDPAEAVAAEGNDELNRRFEAFIKKNYDQMRSH